MLTLYGKAGSRALRCLWALDEVGAAYRHVPTDYADGGTKTAEFLALNPTGTIPTLTDGDVTVWEASAITFYIAAKFGDADFWPRETGRQARILQWTSWAQWSIERPIDPLIVEAFFGPDHPMTSADLRARGRDELRRACAILDGELRKNPWLAGEKFSLADLNVGFNVLFGRSYGLDVAGWPALEDWTARLEARPHWQAQLTRLG